MLQVSSHLHKYFSDLSSSPPGPYGQEMYVFRSEERFKSPPILPPHLLQVILNKDTNISVSILSRLLEHVGILRTIKAKISNLGLELCHSCVMITAVGRVHISTARWNPFSQTEL